MFSGLLAAIVHHRQSLEMSVTVGKVWADGVSKRVERHEENRTQEADSAASGDAKPAAKTTPAKKVAPRK